ncbi:MAG: GNAT family N-acetyltransferase [Bacteroides sp.]|nr:GNAT family N-acetyltransferase [Bacteroides sp.]MCM1550256.1 GNAT family N-acetyltransferase [Clostridium sp.]
MDIIIKRASMEEIDKLMVWRMEVLHHVFAIPENEDMQNLYIANREYYQRSIPSGEHIAVFAEIDGATAGCGGLCLHREMPSPDNPNGACAYLMNIYTREAYREHGVGNAIVRWLVDYAKKQGITKIYLETSDCGRALYESIGFRDMQDYMKI